MNISRSTTNWLFVTPLVIGFLIIARHPQLTGGTEVIDELVDLLGLLISVAGLVIRVVARDWKLRGNRSGLVITGPYSAVRNPMYVGSFLVGFGLCVIIGSIPFLVVFTVFYVVTHAIVVRGEERFLTAKWPDDYPKYKASVPACLPFPSRAIRLFAVRGLRQSSPKQAILREMSPVCGVFFGAAMLEATEDFFIAGWSHAHTEITVSLTLAACVLAVWIVCEVGPARNRKAPSQE